jgi:threonine dehydrogenase-like Zn-dependent dehydrogenase
VAHALAGPGVDGFPAGTRVTARPLAGCGHCDACRRWLIRTCPERCVVGFTRHGAFAEYVTVPASAAYPLPDGLPYDVASLAEPLACAHSAGLAAAPQPGDWVVVIGPGPLGLLATQVLRLRGARTLVAGTRDERLQTAPRCGAEAVCIVRSKDLAAAVRVHIWPPCADAALEMVGCDAALAQALAEFATLRGAHTVQGAFRTGVGAGWPAPQSGRDAARRDARRPRSHSTTQCRKLLYRRGDVAPPQPSPLLREVASWCHASCCWRCSRRKAAGRHRSRLVS